MAGQEAAYNGESDPADSEAAANVKQPAAAKLAGFLAIPNLATALTDEQLADISAKAIRGYEIDQTSREDWLKRNEDGIKLATLAADEAKDYPFPGAANIKYPLITVGALQFNARAYPAIIADDRVCKVKPNGYDGPIVDPQTQQVIRPGGLKIKRAERVAEHSSWQMLNEMPEWEEDTDRMTIVLPITGSVFRKRYWDPTLARQCSRLLTPDRLVINYRSRSLEDVPRISEKLSLYPYEIEERIRDGRFHEFEYGQAQPDPSDPKAQDTSGDDDAPHEFIEQHRLIDLDEDGYAEPYIVTIHLATKEVCRVVCNFDMTSVRVKADGSIAAIRKRDYYVKYLFFPSPDGGAYGMGFGSLLKSTNDAINTTLNQMLDAGHLSNTQGGFINAGAGIREKVFRFSRGEFKQVNTPGPLSQYVLPIKFDGPNATLFQLLGLLIEQGKEVSSTKDVLTGDTGGKTMAPTTTLALIEQGMKVFNAIFKRVFRSLGMELKLHARLNAENLTAEAYNAFFDGPEQYDPKADYNLDDMAITPVSDPSVSTQMQKLAKAQVAQEIGKGKPYINQPELDRRAFEAAGIPDIDKLFVPPPPPDPFVEAMKRMKLIDMKTAITKAESASVLDIANADAIDKGNELNAYQFFLQSLQAQHQMEQSQNGQVPGGPGGLPGVAGAPGNPMGAGPLPPAGAGGWPGGPGPALGAPVGPGPGVGGPAADAGAPAGAM